MKPMEERLNIEEVFQHVWIQSYLKKERNKIKGIIRDIFNVQKLEKWNSHKKLKQIGLLYIATQINTSDIEDIKNTFLFINEKQNGRISLTEMAYFLQINKDQLKKMFQLADSSQDNYIDFFGNH